VENIVEKWKNGRKNGKKDGKMEKFIRGQPPECVFPFFHFYQNEKDT
jgi:hypothetical protein